MPDPRPETRPAPAGGQEYLDSLTKPERYSYVSTGAVSTGTGKATFTNTTGFPLRLTNVEATVGTAPTGASLIVDVNVDGTTAFSVQSTRPTIVAAAKTGSSVPKRAGADVVVPRGGVITVDVDQVGSTVAGANLTVIVEGVFESEGAIDWRDLRDGYTPVHLRDAELLPNGAATV